MGNKEELLFKILAGEASEEEIHACEEWRKEAVENEQEFLLFERFWKSSTVQQRPVKEKVWQSIYSEISPLPSKAKLEVNDSRHVWWKAIAAVFVVVIIAGALLLKPGPSAVPKTPEAEAIVWESKNTSAGQKLTLSLPDGSLVKLNSRSQLRYQRGFKSGSREVFLDGEAFFNVKSDTLHPFTVNAGGLRTRVLGTSFNVNSFSGAQQSSVAVVTGLVEVQTNYNSALIKLHPSEMAVLQVDSSLVKTSYDADIVIGWKEGRLGFERADFDEVIRELSDWYGVHFVLDAYRINKQRYTGSYVDEPLDRVLEGMAFTFQFDYSIRADTVFLSAVKKPF